MNPISNFHTHTQLCGHAQGMPKEFLEQSINDGCTALGFSDHCPYPENFYDTWQNRMQLSDVQTYINSIQDAKQNSPIPIYLGYECEWDKNFSAWYDQLVSEYNAQYLVLGSHWFTEGNRHIGVFDIDDFKLLNKYVDQTIEGMASKKFAFLAHPDLFMAKYQLWDEQSIACSKAIIQAAVDLDLPIEINGAGTTRPLSLTPNGPRFAYPYKEFWELAKEYNAKIIVNSDAHNPQDVIANARKALDFAKELNIVTMENFIPSL